MSKRKSKQLFLLLILSTVYVIIYIYLLSLIFPWSVWVFTHIFELEWQYLLFFFIQFLPLTVVGGFVFVVACCYFFACIGKVVDLLKMKKAEE